MCRSIIVLKPNSFDIIVQPVWVHVHWFLMKYRSKSKRRNCVDVLTNVQICIQSCLAYLTCTIAYITMRGFIRKVNIRSSKCHQQIGFLVLLWCLNQGLHHKWSSSLFLCTETYLCNFNSSGILNRTYMYARVSIINTHV